MFGFVVEVIEGILSFLADVFLLRDKRERNGRPENSWRKDAADVAVWDWGVSIVMAAVAVVVFGVLFYVAGLSFGISLFVALVTMAGYLIYHWIRLTRK